MSRTENSNDVIRGLRYATFFALIGVAVTVVSIVANDMLQNLLDGYFISPVHIISADFWLTYGFPALLVVPLSFLLAAFVNYAPAKRIGFAYSLLVICSAALPFSAVLGGMGMSHDRSKYVEHPPMYSSEIAMFVIPFAVTSAVMLAIQWSRTIPNTT